MSAPSPGQMSGLRKAAILLVMLGSQKAAEAISRSGLQQGELQKLAFEMAKLDDVDESTQRAIADEYRQVVAALTAGSGGLRFAEQVLAQAFGQEAASGIVAEVERQRSVRSLASLADFTAKQLLEVLRDEQPQLIALMLRCLPRKRAAEVLSGLSEDIRVEVVMRLVKAADPSHETLQRVAGALTERAASLAGGEGVREVVPSGGPRVLVEMLNQADLAVEDSVLASLAERDPELGEQVRESMFIFEDLPSLDSRALQTLLREVEAGDLALALKGASEPVRRAVFENLSENAAAGLKEDLDSLGPVRRRDVYAAQQKVVIAARAAVSEGRISIRQAEETEEMIA